jgi:Zn finger protein HypA/HybF involved in hydrogenase expression
MRAIARNCALLGARKGRSMGFSRRVRCRVCKHTEGRGSPALAKPCPKCGSRMTYAEHQPGDQPVTVEVQS